LAEESIEVQDREINLVAEQVVEIVGGELVLPVKKGLQDPGFESAVLLGFQVRVRNNERAAGERLVEARLLDAGRIRKSHPGAGEYVVALQSLNRQRDSRHALVAEGFVVYEARARDEGHTREREHLLPVQRVIAAQPMRERRRVLVSNKAI